jgi:hypothetical protein
MSSRLKFGVGRANFRNVIDIHYILENWQRPTSQNTDTMKPLQDRMLNPLKTEFLLNNIHEFS